MSSAGVSHDELFRRERELKDAKIKLMMLEAKYERVTTALESERQLHSRTNTSLDEFNSKIRELQYKLRTSQVRPGRVVWVL